jgi:hypothetical protein
MRWPHCDVMIKNPRIFCKHLSHNWQCRGQNTKRKISVFLLAESMTCFSDCKSCTCRLWSKGVYNISLQFILWINSTEKWFPKSIMRAQVMWEISERWGVWWTKNFILKGKSKPLVLSTEMKALESAEWNNVCTFSGVLCMIRSLELRKMKLAIGD